MLYHNFQVSRHNPAGNGFNTFQINGSGILRKRTAYVKQLDAELIKKKPIHTPLLRNLGTKATLLFFLSKLTNKDSI